MRSKSNHYEVRCPRCDVSFPVETRTCVHCGGATSAAGEFVGADPYFEFDTRSEADDAPVWHASDESSTEIGGQPHAQSVPLEDSDTTTATPSVGRSILGSMGSLVWIAMLIAFSFASRFCGE